MRYIVIGSEGFIGRALCRRIGSVTGAGLIKVDKVMPEPDGVSAARYASGLEETGELLSLCDKEMPDVVFNLAGSFSPMPLRERFMLNSFAPMEFLEVSAGRRFKIIFIGSAAEYGISRDGEKISEDFPLQPVSDYGISKAPQTFMALRFARRNRLPITVIARPFSIIGPGISENLFFGAFAKQIVNIERGLQPAVIKVGNLDSIRDILSVGKVAECIKLLADYGRHGEAYNICSGRAIKIGDILNELLKLSTKKIRVEVDAKRFKADDVPWSVGDNRKIRELARVSLEDEDLATAIRETLDWFRGQ